MKTSTIQIIIAERNPNIREFLRREFLQQGYRVLEAKDGFDLCNFLRAEDKPDLVVLDIDLPFMDGFVLRELSEKRKNGLAIILLYINDDQSNHPVFYLADYLVEKEENTQKLMTAVREALVKHYPDYFSNTKLNPSEGSRTT